MDIIQHTQEDKLYLTEARILLPKDGKWDSLQKVLKFYFLICLYWFNFKWQKMENVQINCRSNYNAQWKQKI
jgi:hypothetical protein